MVRRRLAFTFLFACFISLAQAKIYHCQLQGDDLFEPHFTLKKEGKKFLINEQDWGRVDKSYRPQSPGKVRLVGDFKSLGDGIEGYNIDLILNKFLAQGSDFGYISLRASGVGYLSYDYKCESNLSVTLKYDQSKLKNSKQNYLYEMPQMCYIGAKEQVIAKALQLKSDRDSLLQRDQGIQGIRVGEYMINFYGDQFFDYRPMNPDMVDYFEDLINENSAVVSQWKKYQKSSTSVLILSDLGPQGDGLELYSTLIPECK